MSTLVKDSKQTYFSSYFKENIKDIKKPGETLNLLYL